MIERVQKTNSARATEQVLLDAALRLFRKNGFDGTTMRDIAREAGVSLGAAYHYFRGKEDIVHAYYRQTQSQYDAKVRAGMPNGTLEEKLRFVFAAKLEQTAKDRRFLGALFRFAADPDHALSVFGPETADVRDEARAIFAFALSDTELDESIRVLLIDALWLAQLALTLAALHDTAALTRTRKLADAVAALTSHTIMLLSLPGAAAFAKPILDPLQELWSPANAPKRAPKKAKR